MGRFQPTHSRGLTWEELLEEGLGDLGLHPWELWDYTIPEFIARRKGRMNKERREYQQIRQLAYCTLLPHLKKGAKKDIDSIVPDMYDDKPVKKKLTAKEIMERYVNAGALNYGGQRDTNNGRGSGSAKSGGKRLGSGE